MLSFKRNGAPFLRNGCADFAEYAVYDDKREKYDFVDDEDILTLTFAKEDDIPEEERYKLKMLSMARKGKLDFYELLLDRGILL